MKEKLRRLPDSELAVMQALWRADAPLTRPELDAERASLPAKNREGVTCTGRW